MRALSAVDIGEPLGEAHVVGVRRELRLGAHAAHHLLGQRGQVQGLADELQRAGAQPRQVQQIVDQHGQMVGLLVDDLQEFALLRGVPARVGQQQRRGVALDRGQGAAQLVGDAADELILQAVDLAQGLRPRAPAPPSTAISRTWRISRREAPRTMAKSEA